jgi:hypothetical protein
MTRFVLTLVIGTIPLSATAGEPELDAILKRAAPLRPSAADLTFREIPWLTDPAEALAVAKAENRPLFVWLAGGRKEDGTPLERC